MALASYQTAFIDLAIGEEALKFGEFTLKSGRASPYFFNAGKFATGGALAALGRCYAEAIVNSGLAFDVLFGPAYKGIPLAVATAVALAEHFDRNVPYCFNRKESKDHGEGGALVGAPLHGRVLIVDDVITAGTAIREVMGILAAHGATAAGVVVGLDRKERGQTARSALEEVAVEHAIPVISIIEIDHLISYLEGDADRQDMLGAITAYRDKYGV